MATLGSVIGALVGSAVSNGYTANDFANGARDFYDSLVGSNSAVNANQANTAGSVNKGSSGRNYQAGNAESNKNNSNVELNKQNAQALLKQYGTSDSGIYQVNQALGSGAKVKKENGNVYYVANGQEYLIGGSDYNKVKFYNGLASGGANSTIMKDINKSQRQIDEYVSQLADYRANLQSSAEKAARAAYVNQQLAQKTLRNNLSRYGLEKSGYYQKSQQNLKSDYEKALADIKSQLNDNMAEIESQESSIRKDGADAIAEILANNGLLTQDTLEFATKEFPILKVSDVPVEQGLFSGKSIKQEKKADELSAAEFAAALNGEDTDNYRNLVNYVFKNDDANEQLVRVKNLLQAGLNHDVLAIIMQRLLNNQR